MRKTIYIERELSNDNIFKSIIFKSISLNGQVEGFDSGVQYIHTPQTEKTFVDSKRIAQRSRKGCWNEYVQVLLFT